VCQFNGWLSRLWISIEGNEPCGAEPLQHVVRHRGQLGAERSSFGVFHTSVDVDQPAKQVGARGLGRWQELAVDLFGPLAEHRTEATESVIRIDRHGAIDPMLVELGQCELQQR
jgi:hypothetical protein